MQYRPLCFLKVRAREFNITLKSSTDDALFEDQKLLLVDFESDPTLGDSVNVENTTYQGDNGVEFVFIEKDNFLKLDTIVLIEYFEDLT